MWIASTALDVDRHLYPRWGSPSVSQMWIAGHVVACGSTSLLQIAITICVLRINIWLVGSTSVLQLRLNISEINVDCHPCCRCGSLSVLQMWIGRQVLDGDRHICYTCGTSALFHMWIALCIFDVDRHLYPRCGSPSLLQMWIDTLILDVDYHLLCSHTHIIDVHVQCRCGSTSAVYVTILYPYLSFTNNMQNLIFNWIAYFFGERLKSKNQKISLLRHGKALQSG